MQGLLLSTLIVFALLASHRAVAGCPESLTGKSASTTLELVETLVSQFVASQVPDLRAQLPGGGLIEATTKNGNVRNVTYTDPSGHRTTIFTTSRVEQQILDLAVSPDHKKVAISISRDLRLPSKITVIDLASQSPIVEGLPSAFHRIFWAGANDLLFWSSRKDGPIQRWNSRSKMVSDYDATYMFPLTQNWAHINNGANKFLLNSSGERFATTGQLEDTIELGNQLVAIGGINNDSLRSVTISRGRVSPTQTIYSSGNRIMDTIKPLGPNILVVAHRGADRWIEILDQSGKLIQEIEMPNYSVFVDATWKPSDLINITFASPAKDRLTFTYDLKAKKFLNTEMENELLTYKGIRFVTEVVTVKSQNGYEFPMRIIRRQDLQPSPHNAALIRAYGGYILPGFLNPKFNLLEAEFIAQGGVIAGPAVRGGNEFGQESWKAGRGLNKINTINDMIASTRWMSTSGWSSPSKIMTRGHSQGGHTVVTAAAMEPSLQALTLATSGVYNPADPRIYNPIEWGDFRNPNDLTPALKISPVALIKAAKTVPRLFVAAGEDDKIVPVDQADALVRAARQNPNYKSGSVQALKIPGYGHGLTFQYTTDLGAQRAETQIWKRIFDVLWAH